MSLRDDTEALLRAWDRYEQVKGAPPVIDYDCAPTHVDVEPVSSRLHAHTRLLDLHARAQAAGEARLAERIGAHLAYLRALLGHHAPLDDYIRRTQGCPAAGWPADYVTARGEHARACLDRLGIPWGRSTGRDLDQAEGPVDIAEVPDRLRGAATQMEPAVRALTGTTARYELTVATVDLDAYWGYWLDGAGSTARLRLNLRQASFTEVRIRQFALHEILGHALQGASWAATCAHQDVPWVRLACVHTQHQVLLEGLAQALPLLAAPTDAQLAARVRLDHYLQLVRAELHLAVNTGTPIQACADHARRRVPFWTDQTIADALTDRGADPLLRSYLWSYPAGIDYFATLTDTAGPTTAAVLHAAYHHPLTPADLTDLWPAAPPIGGPGHT